MMRTFAGLLFLAVTAAVPLPAFIADAVDMVQPCCQSNCTVAGQQKYYSVASAASGKPHCGECCLNPKNYNLYHFFEKNLTLSPVASPCASLFGFTKYDSTVTHGFGPVSVTLDLYDLPNESFVSARYALPELSLLTSFGPPRNDFASVFAGSLDAGKCVDAADKAVMAKEGANLQVIPRHLWYY
jgi:hypothetical protein